MKVLFLDIDGVLNSARTATAFGGYPHDFSDMRQFDMVALALIQRICQKGVAIVISSTWRMHFTVDEMAQALQLPIVGVTPITNAGPRGVEIAHWLASRSDVTDYAIVDDDSDMLPEQESRFVQTSFADGLSADDYLALCKILEVDE